MSVRDIVVIKEPDGWFVIFDRRLGPYTREVAISQAKGLAFVVRTSGGEANRLARSVPLAHAIRG